MAAPPNLDPLTLRPQQSARRDPFSPSNFDPSRVGHVDGDVPPELSPLDALVTQGRMLAKQLESQSENGMRASRLPPLTIASSFAAQRSIFPRSPNVTAPGASSSRADVEGQRSPQTSVQVQQPDFRPTSCHPRLSDVPPEATQARSSSRLPVTEEPMPPLTRGNDRFSIPRTVSPDILSTEPGDARARWSGSNLYSSSHPSSVDVRSKASSSTDSAPAHLHDPVSLTPPRPPRPPRPPFVRAVSSIRSVTSESPEEDRSGLLEASWPSIPRKLSSSSNFSSTTPPRSPYIPPPQPPRSPSVNSDRSFGGNRAMRSMTNFSRPISRASRPSMDAPTRENSIDSHVDNAPTPVSMNSEEYFDASEDVGGPAPAYVYSRFSLPRGRMIQKDPRVLVDDPPELPRLETNVPSRRDSNGPPTPMTAATTTTTPPSPPSPPPPADPRPPSPPSPNRLDRQRRVERRPRPRSPDDLTRVRSRSLDVRGSSDDVETEKPAQDSTTIARAGQQQQQQQQQQQHQHQQQQPQPQPQQQRPGLGRPALPTTASFSVPGPQAHSGARPRDGSAEHHLQKGIECHERGSLNESTYHLRLAARSNHPTGMLLYALACRHGWGMRPNPREGVQWLRKAADLVSLEVADEGSRGTAEQNDALAMKTRRAQFALSIYELGVSHMNGWGIEQDKALALRCFEIAGSWGDCDALSEAGFCYAQGVGCKKDLKKSAKFYRLAESKGMKMVGISWIHKAKYKDDNDEADRHDERQGRTTHKQDVPPREKKPTERSRTRSIFARKKSTT